MSGHPHPGKRSKWFRGTRDPDLSGEYEVRLIGAGSTVFVAQAQRMLCTAESNSGVQQYIQTIWHLILRDDDDMTDLCDIARDIQYGWCFSWRGLAEEPE